MLLKIVAGVAVLLLSPVSVARAADGAAVYKEQCSKCHGETGAADTTVAKTLKVPPLKGDEKVQKMTDAEIVERIKTNEKHPQKIRSLGDEDLTAAAAFAKQLASAH